MRIKMCADYEKNLIIKIGDDYKYIRAEHNENGDTIIQNEKYIPFVRY